MSRRLRGMLVVLGVLLGVLGPVSAAGARPVSAAAPAGISCPVGSQVGTYTPGLTYEPREVAFQASGNVSGCVGLSGNGISGASFSATGHGTASCLAGSVSNTATYHWSNGQTSTVTGTGAINLKPNGVTVLVLTGTVTSGLFTGATVVQTKVLLNSDLTACASPGGLTSVGGPISLTVAL
ncbi:hypothetical protein [Streptomyces olivaceiscleroticus]|uniref:Ig-like domain-containing protein n=1 Tax=Streptomyces olivaceiscleroticus TaxID=68245 RepID=A0ABP3JTE2_9ACTN